jgi:hypothetical protein
MALYPFVLNGVSFDLNSFVGMNYLTGIPAAIEQLIRQITARYGTNLSNTPTFTVAAGKSFTGLQGALFQVGDYIVATGVGFTATMMGTVTAFNPVTGAMTVTTDFASGSGTGTTAVAKLGESSNMRTLISALEPLFGGTGAGGTFSRNGADNSSVFGSSIAGQGASLWDAMALIYDEGFVNPGNIIPNGSGRQDNKQVSPWFFYNADSRFLGTGNMTEGVPAKTAGSICLLIKDLSLQSAIMSYGDRGSISPGKGVLRYDAVIRCDYDGKMIYRFGLKGEGSGRANNIFSYSGIGFELNPQYGGYLNLVVGTNGAVYREKLTKVAQGLTTGKYARFYFETDQEGTQCDFYVNDVLCASYTGSLPNGTNNYRDLLYPAFECSTNGRTANGLLVDTLEVCKSLSR